MYGYYRMFDKYLYTYYIFVYISVYLVDIIYHVNTICYVNCYFTIYL